MGCDVMPGSKCIVGVWECDVMPQGPNKSSLVVICYYKEIQREVFV